MNYTEGVMAPIAAHRVQQVCDCTDQSPDCENGSGVSDRRFTSQRKW